MRPIDADKIKYEQCLTKDGFQLVATKAEIDKMQRLELINENPLDTWDILFKGRKTHRKKRGGKR